MGHLPREVRLMGMSFIPYETIDYVHTINIALQKVFEARMGVRDSITFERYLKAVESLYVILIPRLRPRKVRELLRKARARDSEFGYYTQENLEALDEAVGLIIDTLDRNRLLIKGEVYEEEKL